MQWLEAKIPPPLVALLCGLLAWWLAPLSLLPAWPRLWLLIVPLFMLGGSLDLYALYQFIRAKTTANPVQPSKAQHLVLRGPYRYSRNPMYLGLAINLSAWAFYLAQPLALLAPVIFVVYINRFQIAPEERALRRLFGAEYEAYCRRVRRWI